LELKTLVSLMG